MKEKGYSDLTMYQKKRDLDRFFGSPPSYQKAYDALLRIEQIQKRANAANKINSILKLLPKLIPKQETYDSFLKQQKEWNVYRNKYYTKKDNSVQNHMKELLETCKKKEENWQSHKGDEKEMKYLTEYCMCMMYIHLPEYIGRSVEFRNLKLRKQGTDTTQNYVTPTKMVFGTYKHSSKKEKDGRIVRYKSGIIRVSLPKELQYVLRRMRKLSKQTYLFGGEKALSQSGYHFMQKRVMGFTTNELRKILAQHREGIQKNKMQQVSDKMGNTVQTLLKFYV